MSPKSLDDGRLGFVGEDKHIWNEYYISLKSNHARIKEEEY
jgi:hypothetical protein